MKNSAEIKLELARLGLEIVPPLIRETLLDDSKFRDEYEFDYEDIVVVGNDDISIRRSHLFNAIRKLFSGVLETEIIDIENQRWRLVNTGDSGEKLNLTVSNAEVRHSLLDFSVLSPNSDIRLRSLNETNSYFHLPQSMYNIWRDILSIRALYDEEVYKYYSDLRDTPGYIMRSIRGAITRKNDPTSYFVPSSRRYYERLIGSYNGSASVVDYAASEGRDLFRQLSETHLYDGFLYSLYLSSHPALTAEIIVENMTDDDLVRAFCHLERFGDKTSQLGAIEIGLRILSRRPQIGIAIINLIDKVCGDNADQASSEFDLYSTLFILVDARLSSMRLFSSEPPFYRRLASLSQAALIHRQFLETGVTYESFCNAVRDVYAIPFSLRSFVDMRIEPFWNPNLESPSRTKSYFLDRIVRAAMECGDNVESVHIRDIILDRKISSSKIFQTYASLGLALSGPLDGDGCGKSELPRAIRENIDIRLTLGNSKLSQLDTLIGLASYCRIDRTQADLAARLLKSINYRFTDIESKSQLFVVLDGLATIAAGSRSHVLADELWVLTARYMRDAQYHLLIEEVICICLEAAASREDMDSWVKFVGEWLTQLAFSELENDEGRELHSWLRYLCDIVPELWASCGRADAALKAFNGC